RARLVSMAYLDHAATTPMLPEALEAYVAAAREPGNAASLHAPGRHARCRVEGARERVAAALGARPSEVIFTGGGTESDNLAIKGIYWARRAADRRRVRVVASEIEHHAVPDAVQWLAEHEGAAVTWLPGGAAGRVAAAAEIPFHTDAVQVVGHVPVDYAAAGCDALTVSGHELGGPAGVGALLLGRDIPCTPLTHGGGQERDVRSGTVDVPGVVAFA